MTSISHKPVCWTQRADHVHQHSLTDIYVQEGGCGIKRVAWCQEGRSRAASCLLEVLEGISETRVDKTDGEVGIVGYGINFNRYFYTYEPPRPLEEIEADIKKLESEITDMLREMGI